LRHFWQVFLSKIRFSAGLEDDKSGFSLILNLRPDFCNTRLTTVLLAYRFTRAYVRVVRRQIERQLMFDLMNAL
jgi:hypothetical protein